MTDDTPIPAPTPPEEPSLLDALNAQAGAERGKSRASRGTATRLAHANNARLLGTAARVIERQQRHVAALEALPRLDVADVLVVRTAQSHLVTDGHPEAADALGQVVKW